jgi:hypothetical protein
VSLFLIVTFDDAVNYQDYTVSVMDEVRSAEHRWKNNESGKRKYSEKTPSMCLFDHHKFRRDCPETENSLRKNISLIISFNYM